MNKTATMMTSMTATKKTTPTYTTTYTTKATNTTNTTKILSEMGVAPPHKRFTQFSALIKL